MAKNPTDKPAADTSESALGGAMIPMPAAVAAAPDRKGAASPEAAAPAQDSDAKPQPSFRISRPKRPGNGSGTVMIAGVGEVESKPGVPAFLAGPSPEKREARRLIASVQHDLAQIITTLGRALPGVKENLDALAAIDGIATIATDEGVDLARAADVARELQEALDRAAK